MAERPTPEVERRPITTRDLRISHVIAGLLVKRGLSANAISVIGMIAGIAAGVAFGLTSQTHGWTVRAWWIAAAAFVQLRLLANMLDGMVALASGTDSPVGELYNEVPDRVSDVAVLIGFGLAAGSDPVVGAVVACLAVFVAYVRAMGKSAGTRQEFCGPMAKPQRMFFVTVAALWCAFTPAAWQPALDALPDRRLPAYVLVFIGVGCIVTAARRLRRIAKVLPEKPR